MASLPLTPVELRTVHVCRPGLANLTANTEVAIEANQYKTLNHPELFSTSLAIYNDHKSRHR